MIVILLRYVQNELVASATADDLSNVLDIDSTLAFVVLEIVDGPRRNHENSFLRRSLPVNLMHNVAENNSLIVSIARNKQLEDGCLKKKAVSSLSVGLDKQLES